MVTDDVVVVHGNGRCIRGKEAVKADFVDGFRRFAVDQTVSSAEVTIRNKWEFEIAEVESILTPILGGDQIRANSKTVVVLARQPDASWRVARVLGLLD
jgi:ketosteroid isomerase-like protein